MIPTKFIDNKYKQLSLSFLENYAISPAEISSELDKLPKIFIPFEFSKHPFFLCSDTKKVKSSRIGYYKSKKAEILEQQGVPEQQIHEQTSYISSPVLTTKKFIESADFEDHYSDESCLIFIDEWTIKAHQDFGLPDEFDGFVWDFILSFITKIHLKTGRFYQLYFINISEIVDYFISIGLWSSKSGYLYKLIKDSLKRLMYTKYCSLKGFTRNDTQKLYKEYNISLISSVFFKGNNLPDGKEATQTSIAIDPLILINYRCNKFLIGFQPTRCLLKKYSSRTLFDRLSYHVFLGISQYDALICKESNIHLPVFFSYSKLCSYLGIEPLGVNNLKPSKIFRQFHKNFSELIKLNIISDVVIDYFRTSNKSKRFILFFIIHDSFLNNVLSLGDDDLKSKMTDNLDSSLSQKYFKKLSSYIHTNAVRSFIINNVSSLNDPLFFDCKDFYSFSKSFPAS